MAMSQNSSLYRNPRNLLSYRFKYELFILRRGSEILNIPQPKKFITGNLTTPKFTLAFIVLLIATIIWRVTFYYVLQEYGMLVILSTGLFLYYAWGVFIWQVLLHLKRLGLRKTIHAMSKRVYRFWFSLRGLSYTFVLGYFKTVNQKAKVKLATWYMKHETRQHVDFLIKVLKWAVLPASFVYIITDFCFFRENALDSVFLGVLIFVYSSFLPDLPSIFRKKPQRYVKDKTEPSYKTYVILLFAPLFIISFLLGLRFKLNTNETFHNFKSLIIYEMVLFTLSFLTFGDFPISIGAMTEVISIPLYALTGFLAHLKVDKVW